MSRKLILGSVSRSRLVDLAPIGIVNGRKVFPLSGAEDDANDDDANEDGNDEDDDSENDDSDGDDKDGDEGKAAKNRAQKSSKDGPRNRSMAAELRTLRKFRRETEAAARNKELADKPEIERLTAERDDAVRERDDLRGKYSSASTQLAIITASHGKYAWADIEDVLNDKTLRNAIEIDDDGEVSGVAEALKDLAKRKPHFLRKAEEDNDDKSRSNGRAKSNGSSGNGKSGGQPGSGGSGDRGADRDALAKKYPILNRLPQ